MIDAQAMVFNKVSWMEFYGAKVSSAPPNGETFNNEAVEEAAEAINFLADDKGRAHGLIHAKTLNMGRFGALGGESFMFGTVVSVAPHPEDGRQVIVGWQPHSEIMARRRILKPNGRPYNYRAPQEHAVLLPIEARTIEVPRRTGGMGQSMMAYSVDAKGLLLAWAKEAAEAMKAYDGPNLLN